MRQIPVIANHQSEKQWRRLMRRQLANRLSSVLKRMRNPDTGDWMRCDAMQCMAASSRALGRIREYILKKTARCTVLYSTLLAPYLRLDGPADLDVILYSNTSVDCWLIGNNRSIRRTVLYEYCTNTDRDHARFVHRMPAIQVAIGLTAMCNKH